MAESTLESARAPVTVVGAEERSPAANGVAAVEVAPNLHCQARACAPSHLFLDLQQHAVEADSVVLADRTNRLLEEDLVQIDVAQLHEGALRIRGLPEELLVVGE